MLYKAINLLAPEFTAEEIGELLGIGVDIVYEVLCEEAQAGLSQEEIESLLTNKPESLFFISND